MLREKRAYLLAAIAMVMLVLTSACGFHTSPMASTAHTTQVTAAVTTTPTATPAKKPVTPDLELTSTPTQSHVTSFPICYKPGIGFNMYFLRYRPSDLLIDVRSGRYGHEVQSPTFPQWTRVELGRDPYIGVMTIETNNGFVPDTTVLDASSPQYDNGYMLMVATWQSYRSVIVNHQVPRCTS